MRVFLMESTEIGQLLAIMAMYDYRQVDAAMVIAWEAVIGDLPFDDARAAVIQHYRNSDERIMPSHVVARVRAIRGDRIARGVMPAPPAEVTDKPREYAQMML